MGRREVYAELPSTQDRAVELAREGVEEGSVVVARRQSAGRGRADHRWESPPGGLYLSVVLRPSTPSPMLPLAVGAAVADALTLEYAVRLRLKWPNDLVSVDRGGVPRKLAGVLVDLVPAPEGRVAAVAGIGVNARELPAETPATVLGRSVGLEELSGAPVDLERLESVVVRAAVEARRTLERAGGERSSLLRVRGLLYGAGEPVTVDGAHVGTLTGVRDDGALEVLSPAGPVAIVAGDLHVGVGG